METRSFKQLCCFPLDDSLGRSTSQEYGPKAGVDSKRLTCLRRRQWGTGRNWVNHQGFTADRYLIGTVLGKGELEQ